MEKRRTTTTKSKGEKDRIKTFFLLVDAIMDNWYYSYVYYNSKGDAFVVYDNIVWQMHPDNVHRFCTANKAEIIKANQPERDKPIEERETKKK